MAKDIVLNAKTQRTGVCNAAESLLVHEKIADTKIQLVPIAGNQVACGEWNELSIDRLYAYCTLLERHLNKGV